MQNDDDDDLVIHGIWYGFWQVQGHPSLVYVIAAGMGYIAAPSDINLPQDQND